MDKGIINNMIRVNKKRIEVLKRDNNKLRMELLKLKMEG
jgi:hypothetical protein